MKKRILVLCMVLLIALCCGVLWACSDKDKTSDEISTETLSTEVSEALKAVTAIKELSVKDDLISCTVETDVSSIDLSSLTIPEGTIAVYADEARTTALTTVPLAEGENTFYLTANKDDVVIKYTLKVTRKAAEQGSQGNESSQGSGESQGSENNQSGEKTQGGENNQGENNNQGGENNQGEENGNGEGNEGGESGTLHSHTFAETWSKDETYHWHTATCEHTTEVSDKAEHTWNDGEITTPATEEREGVKTYTCTVCGATKTETIEKLKPSEGLAFALQGDDTYIVTGIGTCTDIDLVIPANYEGKAVTSIGSSAFSDCSTLTSVVIPDSVTRIGAGAFSGCSSLVEMTIPFVGAVAGKTASDTDQYPFGYIFGTTSYTGGIVVKQCYYGSSTNGVTVVSYYIPSSLRKATVTCGNVLYGAFYGCSMLTSISIPERMTSIEPSAFYGCTGLTSMTIPVGVTSIGGYAFSGCSGLTSMTIPVGVTSIGGYAFSGCSGLTSVTFAEDSQLTSIGRNAFEGCRDLISITIGSDVASIEDNAFLGCYKLVEVYNQSSLPITKGSSSYGKVGFNAKNIYAEEGGSKITTTEDGYILYTDGDTVSLIGYHGSVGELTLPTTITEINSYTFYNCIGLTSITIPDSVTSIGVAAFSGCSSLVEMTIPFVGATKEETVDCHFGYIFGGFSSMSNSGVVPASLKRVVISGGALIESDAFYCCTMLDSVTIPSSVTRIGYNAFNGCTGLTELRYEGDVAGWCSIRRGGVMMHDEPPLYINGYKIEGELVLPDSVTNIEPYAFANCASVTSIRISKNVTNIGLNAFSECSSLSEIFYEGDVSEWVEMSGLKNLMLANRTLFIDGTKVEAELVIPDGVTVIKEYSFYKCATLTSIILPAGMKSIEEYAFTDCDSLGEIYYQGDITGWCALSGLGNLMSLNRVVYVNGKRLEGDCVIPEGVERIEAHSFYKCIDLTSITIPASVTGISFNAFNGCTGLTEIHYQGDLAGWVNIAGLSNLMTMSRSLFIDGIRVEGDLIIPDGVTVVSSYSFANCEELTSVIIPNSVTSIGSNVFTGCKSLTSLTIPFVGNTKDGTSYTNFGFIFGSTTASTNGNNIPQSLKSVEITDCEFIGKYAFAKCNGLTSITIRDGVKSIGQEAFSNCSSLVSLSIPDSLINIEYPAIDIKRNLDYNEYENALYLGNAENPYVALIKANSTSITQCTIHENTKVIYPYAFSNCFDLEYNEYENALYLGSTENPYAVLVKAKSQSISFCSIHNDTKFIVANAFVNCSSLRSISIPEGVIAIGKHAFQGCSNMGSITIPFVGGARDGFFNSEFSYIFASGNTPSVPISLSTVVLTGGSSIKESAFSECSHLTSITLPDSIISIGDMAFYRCSALESISIPTDVTRIGVSAFHNCTSLSSITIPEQLTIIENNSFAYCESLSSITIPSAVTDIGKEAFAFCSGLTSITIGASVTKIGNNAFCYCTALAFVTLAKDSQLKKIDSSAFRNCYSLISISIPESVTRIENYAFDGCYSLVEVYNRSDLNISVGSSECGKVAFYAKNVYKEEGTSRLSFEENGLILYKDGDYVCIIKYIGTDTSVALPSNTSEIGAEAFCGCSCLTSIAIPDGVTIIGRDAFKNCIGLSSVTISNGVTTIENNAFRGCTALTSLVIPSTVTSIGSFAFAECTSLNSIAMTSDSITIIPEYAFYGCTGLTSITIPNGVTSIRWDAFSGCSGLTSVTISDSVTSIREEAFSGCRRLTSITFQGTKAQWDAIYTGSNWNKNTGKYTVHCTDGDIAK